MLGYRSQLQKDSSRPERSYRRSSSICRESGPPSFYRGRSAISVGIRQLLTHNPTTEAAALKQTKGTGSWKHGC